MTTLADDPVTLEVLDETRDGDRIEQRLRVPMDLPCLEGHFPGFPVLPGLAQLGWACEAGALLTGEPLVPARIEALKFRELLRPGVEFSATAALARDLVTFEVRCDDRVVASGRLRLEATSPLLGTASIS